MPACFREFAALSGKNLWAQFESKVNTASGQTPRRASCLEWRTANSAAFGFWCKTRALLHTNSIEYILMVFATGCIIPMQTGRGRWGEVKQCATREVQEFCPNSFVTFPRVGELIKSLWLKNQWHGGTSILYQAWLKNKTRYFFNKIFKGTCKLIRNTDSVYFIYGKT